MTISGGIQAWVTSAVDKKAAELAIVLAGSLRRVRTTKKLAVFTTSSVSKELRDKLKEVFHLVVPLDQVTPTPNGLSLEDHAKVQGFSLLIFNKCVYLSPNTLVLKNCDEIFEKYANFAACGNDKEIDPSVYVFTPSLDQTRALEKLVNSEGVTGGRSKGNFSQNFNLWMQNNIPNSERLERKYNLPINLQNYSKMSMEVDIKIANFKAAHPLDIPMETLMAKVGGMGYVEKLVVDLYLQIYVEDLKSMSHDLQLSCLPPKEDYENEPIAVVGMSFRLPGGNGVDEFWDLLVNGREAIQTVPPFRWTREHVIFPCKNRKFEAGFLNVPIDEFDAKFFGVSPKEAVFLDPQQRLLHEVSWEAWEDAMIDPNTLHGTQTGFYVGSWIHDYRDIAVRSSDVDFFRVYMGNSIASEASRLSHFYGTTGPSIATESGCSSAIVAVHMACKSLRNHESSMAMACGVNLLIHPQDMSTLSFVVAPDGRCKTFDSGANGFGRAEACAVLVLKRYSDAIRDENKIWGLIRGSAVTQEGVSKSLGTPTVHCESLAMELALKDAHLRPDDVSYIEAHGTGTTVGDPMEIAAITKAYSNNGGRDEPLIIGSVKTNVGHTESASGITGIIKVLLSMKNETIPPHLNLKTLNPEINLDTIPAQIPLSPMSWKRQEVKPRLAGVSSFGISGTDGHAIIQEAPIIPRRKIDFNQERPLHIMKISAKCQHSLDQLLSKYEAIFTQMAETDNEQDFADMAYSANFGRSTFNHRAVVIASNFSQAAKIIRDKSYRQADVQSSGSKLCFVFTGQGSQYPNMASTLYLTSPIFKDSFDKCSELLKQRYSISIKDVLWGDFQEGEELSRTLYSQTSIFCVEYCLLKLWESWGVKPDYVMGHSLGEFAAAVAAGALTFEDALMLVAERSKLIDTLPGGKMLVIKADKRTVDQAIAKFKESHSNFWADYAALNSSDQTVIAGDSTLIEEFSKYCQEKQLKSIVLAATHAFHSRHMDPILEAYFQVAMTVKRPVRVNDEAPKYISALDGKLLNVDDIDAEYWVRHARNKVCFIDSCNIAREEGINLFLEIGPHPVLSALLMMNIEGQSVTCLPSLRRKEDDWVTLLDSLSKLYLSEWKGQIDWKGFDQFYPRQAVNIPFYQFSRKSIWANTRPALAELHPLVGRVMPNASGFSIFEQEITLKKVDFAQDHVIGNTVVFPGAGYLEMCLVGGHSCVQSFGDTFIHPRRPVSLKRLKIMAPLALQDSQICILQTVAGLDESDEDEMGYSVNVYRVDLSDTSAGGQWRRHAAAKFMPVVGSLPPEIAKLDIAEITQSWEKVDNKEFYEKLPEVGLRFGPKFQSLQGGWTREDKGVLLEVKVPTDTESYVIHPVIADAMIQAAMLLTSKDKLKRKLQVPVHVGEFIWLDTNCETSDRYIFCSKNTDGIPFSLLVNDQGSPIAYMSGIDFAETTVKLIEGMILEQESGMPQMWEEIWKPQVGPMQRRIEITRLEPPDDEILDQFRKVNEISDEEINFHSTICHMSTLNVVSGLYKLGWSPEIGESFTLNSILESLSIQQNFEKYIRFFLNLASDAGYFENNTGSFIATKSLPTFNEMERLLKEPLKDPFPERIEYRMMTEIGKLLPEIFTGKAEVLTHLFPTDPSKPSAQEYYQYQGRWVSKASTAVNGLYLAPRLEQLAEKTLAKMGGQKPVVRILEVGAGTGSCTKHVLAEFQKHDFEVEYYFTDISAGFFMSAEKLLKDQLKFVTFKKFNMELDPFHLQGFIPEYFDMIMAFEVLHVAKELRPVLQRLRTLLKPHGILEFYETVLPDPGITYVFGLLDGYWQFQDHDLRPDHITLSTEKWTSTLKEAGFETVTCVHTYNYVHAYIYAQANEMFLEDLTLEKYYVENPTLSWIILSDGSILADVLAKRLRSLNRWVTCVAKPDDFNETFVKSLMHDLMDSVCDGVKQLEGIIYLWGMPSDANSSERDQSHISLPLVTLFQVLLPMETFPKLYIFTRGIYSIQGSDVLDPSPGTLSGLTRALHNEHFSLKIFHMDLSPTETLVAQADEAFYNLWTENDGVVAFSGGKRLIPKISYCKPLNETLSLPNGCDRFQMVLPKTRMISDLEFAYLDSYTLSDLEIEVKVKAMALNFRDVFTVLKPLPLFEELNTVGLDFAGVVTKIGSGVTKLKAGDQVIGMNLNKNLALPSHIKTEENLVVKLPPEITFAEGVTLPAVFSTAVYCLIHVAKMKRGETLLVHTASGGVGLCAIQLAQQIGVHIIATAGSTRKRAFLRNLGIKHVFHSRTTDFGKQILEVTNGHGVDIVLNSITGPGFKEASLDALARNGRFIEMSKLNAWTDEEVKALRPDVFYRVVDLTTLEKNQYEELSFTLKEYLNKTKIRPIPYERFDALNIRGALNYLQKAKHIGKIVCVMPEVKKEKSKLATTTPLFNDGSTYLVTGGFGGIGFEIVKWMLNNGAKHVAIVSRSAPNVEVTTIIERINKSGKHVEAFAVDVGDYSKCKELFERLNDQSRGFPPIRGVMHAAGVLKDATVENQCWDSFMYTYNAKVNGSWNLHELTKDLLLEHFVVFSSLAAVFGSPGQTNHSASNSFEDTLANYRKSIGLPSTSINWGNWGEVGVATEVDLPGVRPISTKQGLLALENFLKTQRSHTVVMNIDSFSMLSKFIPGVKTYVDDKRLLGENKSHVTINTDEFWAQVDGAQSREEKMEVFKTFIKSTVKMTLKMDEDDDIDDNAEFQVLGIDSLMMLEMKNGLQNVLGSRLTLTTAHLKDCHNTQILANRLVNLLIGDSEAKRVILSKEELRELMKEDAMLPESICVNEELASAKKISEIETVLLTGVTGNLGPYLLRNLSQRPHIKKIYCLIRKSGKCTPAQRLQSRLEYINLLHEINMEKVECIQGDITDPQLGLSEPDYQKLSEEVDAICHSAVRADHTATYWKAPTSKKNHIRTVNVLGTVHLLEFATTSTLKHFYYLSTLLTVVNIDDEDCLLEEWQNLESFHDDLLSVNFGYPQSKFIAEMLVKQAVERGIPVKTFRLPAVAGDSRTGRMDFEMNHVILRFLAYMKLNCMPDTPTPLLLIPVDHCANISLDVFFNPEASCDVYNVGRRGLAIEQTLIEVAQMFDIKIEPVPFMDFVEKLKQEDENSPLANFKSMYEVDGSDTHDNLKSAFTFQIQKFVENSENFCKSRKLLQLYPNYDEKLESNYAVMKRDLQYLKDLGIFEKFGIK